MAEAVFRIQLATRRSSSAGWDMIMRPSTRSFMMRRVRTERQCFSDMGPGGRAGALAGRVDKGALGKDLPKP
jgi:hypothetical protein